VGAGAIGNEVSKNLVLSGFRNITIIDMDRIEISNLNRCIFFSDSDAQKKVFKAEVIAKKLGFLNENINVNHITNRIQDMPENFIPSFDLVLGCLDNIESRLHVNAFCYHNNIPYIDGATDGFSGKVQLVLAPETPCLECNLNKTHMKLIEVRRSCTDEDMTFYEDPLSGEITTTSIIAAFMVKEAVKIVSEREDVLQNAVFYYDGLKNVSENLKIEINPNCFHHDKSFP
jgi:molybdopterin/thiamine biosynthesis adenylyltransferase